MGNSSRADELIKKYGLDAPQNTTSTRAQQLINQYGLDATPASQRTAATAARPTTPQMWEPTIEDYEAGAAAYVEKKKQQEAAKRGMFSAGLDILGNAAVQAQRAATGVYADQQQVAAETQRALEASGRFFDAKEQFDEARALQDWQGREEAVDEYKKAENNYVSKLIRSALIFNPGNDLDEQREKLKDQREKIEVRDIAAGNGPRALTGLDRADQVIGGTAKGIGADLSMTFGEFYRLTAGYPFNAPAGDFLRGENRKVWEEQQEQIKTRWTRIEDFAKNLSIDASASLETAKNGLGITGQAGVDIAQNAIEMTFDHFAGMLVGSPLVVMFARVYGQADMEAQRQGLDVDTAATYGLSKAAIEVATERMFDIFGIYGGTGMNDKWVEDLVYKLADDSVGQWFLRTLLNASGEGAEEIVSAMMDPITQMILDPSLTFDSYGERLDTADMAYSAFIGATLGLFSAAHVGQHRAANAALAVRRNMAEELRSRGYSDNLSEQVAPTLAKAVMGEELTEAEQAELQRWPTAQEVLQDIETSRELQTIVENAQQAETEEPAAEDDNVPTTEAAETETAQPRRTTMTAEDYARRVIDAEPETADTSTEEGRARLQSATANLGGYSDAAVQAYESGQDVSTYAAGMYEAAAVYAAAGADVKAAVQQARDGKIRSAMRVLTDKQVAIAEDIGRQMREDTTKAAADVSAAYSVIRQQAAAIGTRAAQNTARISAAVRRANSIGSTAMATFKAQRDALEAMVQANPELEGSEEFNRLFDEAKRNMETVQRMQRAVENLKNKRAKAEEEQRRVTEHKAGRVSYETKSGSVGGVQYEAVDRSKLTQTQQAVTRIAEAIAKATGLEIHVARFGGKIGGEYLRGQGGVIWLNIDANYKGANIAIGSLTHELTHWLQEYAPEEYQKLKRVVLDDMTRDPARYAQIFGDRARVQPDLSPDKLTDDMTANACQVLFMDEASVQRIVSENRNLGQKILDFFKSILSDIKAAFSEIDTSSDFTLYQEVRAAEGAIDQMRDLFVQAMHTATENLQAERTVQQENVRLSEKNARNATAEQEERTAGLDTREQTKVQFQRYVQDEETAQFLKEQEDEGKVIHTYKSFLEIDGKLYPPMASKEKGADGTYRMRNAIEPGRWVESEGNLKNIIIDPKNGRGYFNLKKDDGSTIKAAYNPYQHSSNLMLNDQFTGAYSRPNLVTYECIIPESELTSGYRAEYAKDAVGLHPWKSGPVAGKLAKAKGTVRQVYLSRWLKPIRKVPEAEVAQHYKELLDGTDIGVPSNVVPPALLRALEDAGVKIEYDERAPQQSEQMTDKYEKASNSAASEAVSEAESSEESSKTNAQFQRWDDTTDDTADEKAGREMAYARIQSENAVLTETVAALRKLTAKQDNTIEKLQKRLQLTKTPEVRETDARNLARQLIAEHSSRADLAEVTAQIKALGDYLLQTNTQDVSEDELKNRARQIAAGIIDAATENINLDSERYQQIAGDIKGKKLSIDEDFLGELDAAGGYEKFRKSLFGSLTLAKRDSNTAETREDYTSVSQFYADMQSTYGKGSFPDVANEGEEIQILAQMLDAGEPTEVNPYEKYRGEATEELSNRIVMDALNGVLRTTPPTDADRQKSRRVALQQQIKALKAENKLSEREAGRLYATIYDLSVALDKAESRYTTLRKEADIRAAKVYQEGLARAAEIKASERAKAADKIQELKEHYKKMQRNARERRENTASRNKIRRLIDRLNDRLKHPTANKYVPKELVQLTIDTLNLIDIDTGTGSKTMAEKLADIRTTYAKYQADEKYSVVYDPVTAQMLDNLEQEIRGTKLKDMNEKQLNMVYETLKSLMYVVDKAVNVRIGNEERNAFELSKEMTDETRAVPKAQTGWIREHAIPAHLRADVAFDRFGGFKKNSAWTQVARLLNDGQLKQTRLRMELSIPFAELFNNQKALADYTGVNAFGKIDSKKLVDVGLKDADGNAIHVTRDFMVALYLDLLNEGNRLHFIRGGKTVPDFQKYYDGKDAYGAGSRRAVGISEELSALYRERNEAERANYGDWSDDVKARIEALESEGEKYANQVKQTIERLMTDYDRAWVKAIQQLMDVDSKRELNQTTMDVYGIEKAQVPNYFPLFSDKDFIASDMETVSQNISLENAGFMKERVKSGNPTRAVGSVWAVKTQIDRVAQYCGLMPAIRSFNKIYNKTQSGYADSLKKALGQQFGKSGTDYVENLIADLSGGRAERTDEFGISRAIGRLRGNLARSSLTFNPRVALGQAASYPTAAAELGYKALGKALAHGGRNGHIVSRADKELIAKWSPLLWYRMQGYSTPELGDIQGSNRFGDRVWRKFRYVTGWIQAVDGATVGRLWYAAEYWVQDNKPNLEKGSDAYYEAVAEKFNAVVEKTQPNYTTMQRAAILRNPDSLIKTLTMFMTQRLQNFNILYDAAGRYQKARADFAANGRNGVTQADVNEARTDMTRAVTSQIAQAALFVGMKMFVDFLLHSVKKYRDKETGDLTAKSVSLSALDAFCDTLLGNAVFGSELYGIGKAVTGVNRWYGLSISGVDTVNDLIESIVNLSNANVKWDDESSRKAFYNRVLKVGTNGAQAAGYPLNNAVKMGQAVYYHIKDAANGHFLSYESDANRTNAQKAEKWIRALEGGDEAAAEYAKSLFDDEKKAISALKDALKDSVADGERTAADASEMLVKAGMTKNDAFFLTQGWETGDSGKYTAVKRAALAGDTAAFRQAMSDLTTHGVKRETAQSEIKKFIRALYMGKDLGEEEREIVGDKKLTSAQARKLLHDYGDLSVDDAVSTVNSWDEVLQFNRKHGTDYETYGLTINQARYYYDNDTVKNSLRFADYASYVGKFGLDAVKEYYGDEDWKATGLTMAEYADYAEKAAKCKGTDKNGDGKVDRYSKKNQMVELITSLPVSIEVKDAIYLKNGWSASQVRSMPWH